MCETEPKRRRRGEEESIMKETYSQRTIISSFNKSKSLSLLEHHEQWDLNKTRVNKHFAKVQSKLVHTF